jgi:hypothetical protein
MKPSLLPLVSIVLTLEACSSGSDFSSRTPQKERQKDSLSQSSQADSTTAAAEGAGGATDSQADTSGQTSAPTVAQPAGAVQPPPAANPAPNPPPPPPPAQCDLNDYTIPINVVQKSNTPAGRWYENTASFSLPGDATEIRLRIVSLVADDNSARVWINDNLVVDLDSEDNATRAHQVNLNNDISGAVRAGNNTIKGRVLDYYGTYASLRFKISGSYKTGQGCNVGVN